MVFVAIPQLNNVAVQSSFTCTTSVGPAKPLQTRQPIGRGTFGSSTTRLSRILVRVDARLVIAGDLTRVNLGRAEPD